MFNPIKDSDLLVNADMDLVLRSHEIEGNNETILESTSNFGEEETLIQILKLVLKTKKGSWKNSKLFGASPSGKKILVTTQDLILLQSRIKEELIQSGIPYPVQIKILKISPESILIVLSLSIVDGVKEIHKTISFVLDESRMEIKAISGYGG